jgi:hypothetical protein
MTGRQNAMRQTIRRWLTVLVLLLVVAGFAGIFVGAFGLAVKSTDMYKCALVEARRSPVVLERLGSPVTEGFFAWTSYYSQEGTETSGVFGINLAGPHGSGVLHVQAYANPLGSSLQLALEQDGKTYDVYRGSLRCS